MKQPEYVKGDLVRISREYSKKEWHMDDETELAIVMYDNGGNLNDDREIGSYSYGILTIEKGRSAWHPESCIVELVDSRRMDLIEDWEKQASERNEREHKESAEEKLKFIVKMITESTVEVLNSSQEEDIDLNNEDSVRKIKQKIHSTYEGKLKDHFDKIFSASFEFNKPS